MAEVVNVLLSHGHRYEDVFDEYTMDEIRILYESIQVLEMRQLKMSSISQFNAARGTGKGFKEYLQRLDEIIEQASRTDNEKKTVGGRLFAQLLQLSKAGQQ
jgi:hypothetical protein